MAYYVDFMSFGGTAYRVEIGDTGGTPLPLTGGPEPFVTQEDDGGDLFTPVRLQTGTIRVIDDGSLMADIIPENNTTTKVRLKNSGATVWEGYLCAAGYSQPWDGNLNMIELPVQSVLSSLYDVSIDTLYLGQLMSFSDIINAGIESIGYSLHVASTADDCSGAWMSAKVNASVFFSKEEISNGGYRQTAYFGKSYGEIIEDICKLFGLMCRDTGIGLLFATYDKPTGFAVGILTSVFTFKGSNNEQGFMQGKKTAKVVVSLGDTKNIMTELPFAPETPNPPVIIDLLEGKLYVQEYSQRTGGIEAWSEFEYSVSVDSELDEFGNIKYWWVYSSEGTASFSDFSQNCLINDPSQHLQDNSVLYTGAFPVRWFYQQSAETVRLKNGLFIQQQTAGLPMNDVVNYNVIYSIGTEQPFSLNDGYIVLNMSCNAIEENVVQTKWIYDSGTMLFVSLQFGDKYWNGTEWSDTLSRFSLRFENGRIVTNKTAEMNVDADSGYFIPVLSKLEGYVSLHIYDVCCNMTYVPESNTIDERGKIISDLEISFFYLNNLTASDRSTNVYRQTILNSGFGEDKTIGFPIGTMNNNLPTQALIKSDATTYIETLSYGGVNERPEMHLLDRMVSYYDRVRQTLRAKVGTGLGLFGTLYSHGGRVFVGIDAQHNWRDDTQEVEFIEVRTE